MVSPEQDEEPPVAEDGNGTQRLEAFSDAVMAIAITILVLEFKVPEGAPEETDWRLGAALIAQWPSYVAYGMSFVVLGVTWASHHRMFQYIARIDWTFLLLNLLFLLIYAFVPYPTALVAKYLGADAGRSIAVVFYGGVMTAFAVTYNALWWYASAGGRLLGDALDRRGVRQLRREFAVGLIGYPASMGIAMFQPMLSIVLFVALAVLMAIAPGIARRRNRKYGAPGNGSLPGA
jgi:uncharacterized membrane protein